MRHARISAFLLLATGLLHTLIGLVDGFPQLAAVIQEGLVNKVVASPDREAAFWFLIAGFGFILCSTLAFGYDRRLPPSFGWSLLILSITGTLFLPLSGFLFVIPQAVYILVVARQAQIQPFTKGGRA